ncbi:MAG: hypothetical protein WCJ25_05065 [Candidatus Moraniibacteriota bacterium]
MKGTEVILALKKKFKVTTDRSLADVTGLSIPSIQNWKNRTTCTPLQVAGLVYSASKSGAVRFRKNAIRPLVEFFEIELCDSMHGANDKLFDCCDEKGDPHPYFLGLKEELDITHGVYLFFDSRGQAIYVGKARRQSLWKEMNLALNRDRGKVQMIKRVKHPVCKMAYRTSDEKSRQIVDQQVPLSGIASYFSAYEVDDKMIEDVEALLVRSFANNLLNKRMERFARHRYPVK